MKRSRKVVAWVVGIIVILIVAIIIFIVTFDWNRMRPWVDDKVSQAIGRTFVINGDLRVHWHRPPGETGWRALVPWPHFSAEKITIANPDWAKNRYFATLDEIDFDIGVLPLLAKNILIPSVRLVNPAVDLERTADGRNTWTFKLQHSDQPSQWNLDLRDIVFAKGDISLLDAQKKADLHLVVDTLGQPIPFGEALKQQSDNARKESAEAVGQRGAAQLTRAASAAVATEAASQASAASAALAASADSATSAASGASVTAAGNAPASSATPTTPSSAASATADVSSSAARADAHASEAIAEVEQKAPSAVASNGTRGLPDPYAIGWTLSGSYNKTRVNGVGKLGGILSLQNAAKPFPVQADVKIGDTRIALVGTLTDPTHLSAIDLRLWLSGVSMSHLYSLTGVTLPDTPPYATEGRLLGQFRENASVFTYQRFTGRVGGSDLNGTLTFEQRQPRPRLTGTLVSNLLQFSDLAPVIGADSNASKEKRGAAPTQPSNKALPTEQFRTDRWKALDADVKFTGRRIVKDPALPFTDLYTHVIMKGGVLTLEPLRFGVAGGNISSDIGLDGSTTPLKGRLKLSARHLKLKQLFPTFNPMKTSLGEVNGDSALSATGNSVAALLGSSNGEVKLLVNDGAISRFLMEAAGLNVGNIVLERLFGNRNVKINCAAADFVVTNGLLDSKVFVFDTDDAIIDISGNVNLSSEAMDLSVKPHTKGFRIFSLRSPLYVKGTFKDPHVGVQALPLILKGGGAIALGLLNPLAALIPLMSPGRNEEAPCGSMLTQMKSAPSAPPPGQKQSASVGNNVAAAASAPATAGAPPAKSNAPLTADRKRRVDASPASNAPSSIYKGN
ncbi:MAG: AsmA family protein [Janthinobacterium lividum]